MSLGAWELRYDPDFLKDLKKLDKPVARRVVASLERLSESPEPVAQCKALTGNYAGFWRYRIGNYRAILHFDQGEFIILALEVGHRSKIYL